MKRQPSARAADYLAARKAGKTYTEIAAEFGVSKQAVHQVCAKYEPNKFKTITPEKCVYPMWRNWMNENRVSKSEVLRRMGVMPSASNSARLSSYMCGGAYPSKPTIDKLLAVTGLTYEQLFTTDSVAV